MAINLNGTTGITTTGLTSNGIDDNATSTAMTLDTSGNVLVGTTSSFGSSGITLGSNNVVYAAASSQNVANFQRYTTDGEIVRFGKSGSTVGRIGNNGARIYIGSDATGLFFNNSAASIEPYNTSTSLTRDAAIDFGSPDERFKDLYLSGGVFLGGAGSSNKLDDYEEGTHQTSVTMSGSGTVTLNTSFDRFSYTKTGRLVTITGNPRISSVSSPAGNMILTIPFAAVAGQTDECRAGGIMRYYDQSAGAGSYSQPLAWSIQEGASTVVIDNTNTKGNNPTPAAGDEFYFSISYMTN